MREQKKNLLGVIWTYTYCDTNDQLKYITYMNNFIRIFISCLKHDDVKWPFL